MSDADPPPIAVSKPATLSGIRDDLLFNAPMRSGRSVIVYAFMLVFTALLHPGFHAALLYRLSAACHKARLVPLTIVFEKLNYHLYHCILPGDARIGPGLFLPHPLGIVLSKHARLGREVTLRQFSQVMDVTEPGVDGVVGDGVQINAFAAVSRGGSVGEESVVAAKALVTKRVPAEHLAIGIPAGFKALREDQKRDRSPRWR